MSLDPQQQFQVSDVLPHQGHMVLVDRIVDFGDDYLVSMVSISNETQFLQGDAVPAWVGIEYMAQSIAAYSGIKARLRGQPIKIGFLLGAREYESNVAGFCIGAELVVTVKELICTEEGLGVFACRIEADGVMVNANVNVFQPDDLQEFENEMKI